MKKAVMYGAGSIGRGFIAELFDCSGYETVFIDTNTTLIDRLNAAGEYPLRFVSNDEEREITVHHVRGVYGDDEKAIAGEIATADLMATSVGKGVLPRIAPAIAAGLLERWKSGHEAPLNIIVCENMIHANQYLRELLEDALRECLAGEEETRAQQQLQEKVGLVETCIGRNVPVMTAELYGDNPLRVLAEDYHRLPVDETTFVGEVPELAYLEPVPSFAYFIREKLFLYNMAHAVIGYLGSRRSILRLCDAIEEPDIRYIVNKAFAESACGMAHAFDKPLEEILSYCDSLLYRFHNTKLHIHVPRLAQDPLRKLGLDDRLVGPARLCEEQGIFPAYLAIGIAAGYCFDSPDDPASQELQAQIRQKGIDNVLAEVSGLRPDERLFQAVRYLYDALRQNVSLRDLILEAEKLAQKP